jgi:NADPH:quinone reductase-like Zn-dependent oxidoreductase
MKAAVVRKYGLPQHAVEIRDVPTPNVKDNEILIKVHYTTVNDYDWSMTIGKPLIYRLLFGFFKPRNPIAGMELSGIVVETGATANRFKAGDAVYGDISAFGFGSFAEYVSINENAVRSKPKDLGFIEAAAIPHASLLALQGLRESGKISQGQKVLINGGGGGVGTFALQLAKTYDCHVTGVDTGPKLEEMRTMGYDHVIDYRKENFTKSGAQYDLVLDCKSNKSPFAYLRSLKPKGTYVTVGGSPGTLIRILFWSIILRLFTPKRLRILSLKSDVGLDVIEEMFSSGKLTPVIDGPFTFEEIPKAIQYFGNGEHTGKVVIRILPSRSTVVD